MLAVSLWQPWASLLADGEKRVDTRSWRFPKSLPCVLAIHAAKKWDTGLIRFCRSELVASALRHCGIDVEEGDQPPLGAIIGIVRVVECWDTGIYRQVVTEQERAFGDYAPGRFAWVCDEFCGLSSPVPCCGRQGLFNWPVPAGLLLPEWARAAA